MSPEEEDVVAISASLPTWKALQYREGVTFHSSVIRRRRMVTKLSSQLPSFQSLPTWKAFAKYSDTVQSDRGGGVTCHFSVTTTRRTGTIKLLLATLSLSFSSAQPELSEFHNFFNDFVKDFQQFLNNVKALMITWAIWFKDLIQGSFHRLSGPLRSICRTRFGILDKILRSKWAF